MDSEDPKETLRSFGRLGAFVADNGLLFASQPLPSRYRIGRPKACYYNSYQMAVRNPRLTYVEGYATHIIPIMHAWCVDQNGNVHDRTWANGEHYVGLPIKTSYLKKVIQTRKKKDGKLASYALLDDWQNRFPLLTLDPKIWFEDKIKAAVG
jgi:hypothetical protein